MLKYVLPLLMAGAIFVPSVASADCGCGATSAYPAMVCGCDCCPVKTRKKLMRVEKQVTRCQRVCVVDECGNTRVERVPVTKTVTRLQRVRVPVEPRCRCKTPVCGCGC